MYYISSTSQKKVKEHKNQQLKEQIKLYIAEKSPNKSILTIRSYHSRSKNILAFLGTKNPPMNEVNYLFVNNYSNYLAIEKAMKQNTINKNLKFLKQVVNHFEEKNPDHRTNKIKIEKDTPTTPRPLTLAEVEKIKQAILPENLVMARDYFLFQIETGFHFVDFVNLKPSNFYQNRYIKKQRSKTGIEAILPLTKTAHQIAEKYNYNFNKLHNAEYNLMLKSVAFFAKIRPSLVVSDARDTFADYWGNVRGIALDDLAIMMGLNGTKELKKYLRIREQRILNAANLWA